MLAIAALTKPFSSVLKDGSAVSECQASPGEKNLLPCGKLVRIAGQSCVLQLYAPASRS